MAGISSYLGEGDGAIAKSARRAQARPREHDGRASCFLSRWGTAAVGFWGEAKGGLVGPPGGRYLDGRYGGWSAKK